MVQLPPIIDVDDAAAVDGAIWCDVRWYLDGSDGHAAYVDDHIAGAIFVDLDEHLAAHGEPIDGRHPMPSAEAFARSLGQIGIGPADPVIAYDDRQGVPAGRFVWMLRSVGHPAALLNGGLDAWHGRRSTGEETLPPTSCPVRPWPDLIIDADATAEFARRDDAVVVDARAGDRYRGETEPLDPRPGHIPGAINVPYGANLDADGLFLPSDALRRRFDELGLTGDERIVHYCGSGVSACHNMLAMEHAGLGASSLYPGSWSAWSNDPDRPAAVGPEPGSS